VVDETPIFPLFYGYHQSRLDHHNNMTNTKGSTTSPSSIVSAVAASGSSSSSSTDSKCNVDGIMRDMLSSFSRFTSTGTYQAYDSISKKGCSINWKAMFIPSTYCNATESDPSSNRWWSSLDYLKSINFSYPLTSGTTTNGTGSSNNGTMVSTPSYSQDMYERLGNLSNQLISENRITASVTKSIEECLSSFARDTLQMTTTGIFFGAVVGAAVATGVMVGMMVASAAVASSDYVPWLVKRMSQLVLWQSTNQSSSPESREHVASDKVPHSSTASPSKTTTAMLANGPLMIIQGHPLKPQQSSPKEQCDSCLDQIDSNLRQNDMTWVDMSRLTAYLVAGKCNAGTFRDALQQCIHQRAQASPHTPLVTIVFVQQLEDENAMLQLEGMASKRGS
jgi:hypothetical protein